MSHRNRSRIVVAALTGSLALVAIGCGFDSSSSQTQNATCNSADVGSTTRESVRAELGAPTVTEHETHNGRRVVVDMWLDGSVGFEYDEQSHVLVEKDC